MPLEQRVLHFSGTVQGVGFRYTAVRVARNFEVTGYIRNLPDGRVQCVLEGERDQIDGFIAELRIRMADYPHEVRQQTLPYSGAFDSFGVRM
jgi:acylphosphatase